jgi:hypothetical protein
MERESLYDLSYVINQHGSDYLNRYTFCYETKAKIRGEVMNRTPYKLKQEISRYSWFYHPSSLEVQSSASLVCSMLRLVLPLSGLLSTCLWLSLRILF